MSKEITDKAKEYLKIGLSILPTGEDKNPALSQWDDLKKTILTVSELDELYNKGTIRKEIEVKRKNKKGEEFIAKGIKLFKEPVGLAVITGSINGNLEVIDVDTKYDITGSLWDELRTLIQDNLPDLYSRLVIAQTKSGGYHIYYRCSSIAGNVKIANRNTTTKEREETYEREKSKGVDDNTARTRAVNDKVRVLIETRGEGGYVVAPPTIGYTYIQGEPGYIPTITTEERDILFSISKSFNENEKQETREKQETNKSLRDKYPGKTSLEDYDERGDLLGLLISEGWEEVKTQGDRVYLLRPGSTDSKSSGNYHKIKNCFICFSSSTDFKPGEPYSPSETYNLLKCNGDWSRTALELGKTGYGDYKPNYSKQPEMRVDRIKVEVVNKKTRESSVISTPGDNLKIENIQTAIGEEVVITSPGLEAQEEVLKAIDLILKTGKRIYIKEGGDEIREYSYQLRALFKKYGKIEDESGGLTHRDLDTLLDEVVIISTKLQPIDKDVFLKEFTSLEAIKELGISEESLSITVDRLTSTRDKEAQAKEFKKLLSEATQLQDKGETDKALELLDSKVKEVKLKDKATEFSRLLIPTSEAKIKEEEANLPDSLNTGFKIDGEELLLPGGAISVYAAPTNHGKTVLLINTVINVAQRYPDKKFIFFTYEERDTAILQYFLNTYIDVNLNKSNATNRRILREYFKTGNTEFISSHNLEYFRTKKDEFFTTYIETGRILVKYVDYNSQELTTAIEYINKESKDIGGVFIDYFQLLKLPKEKSSRQEELKQICMSLKDTAVRTGLPLILAAQFNREVTNLLRLHPTNIGEAGDIERIVNTLVGLWNMDKKPVLKGITEAEAEEINIRISNRIKKAEGTNLKEKNMYLEILKSRDLPTGSYDFLEFNGNTGKVKNLEAANYSKDIFK
jgi:replicative DNA helicase